MKGFLIIGLLSLSLQSIAAVAPFYQSVNEIDAILKSDKVASELGGLEAIQGVKKIKNGYLISTESCDLEVGIKSKPLPKGMMGSAGFTLKIGKADCQD